MDMRIAKEAIALVRAEARRRADGLPDDADANAQRQFFDQPFIADLCIALLVAVSHGLERDLLALSARATDGIPLSGIDFSANLKRERNHLKSAQGWERLATRLNLGSFPEWSSKSIELLRHLANAYKHEPLAGPSTTLISHLRLDVSQKYAPLAESHAVREAIALHIHLPGDADYTDIADALVGLADDFRAKVEAQPLIGKVKWGPMALDSSNLLH